MIWRDAPLSGANGQQIWAGRTANQAILPKMGEMGDPLWNKAMVQWAALFAAALP